MRFIKRIMAQTLARFMNLLPSQHLIYLLRDILKHRIDTLEPREALRFLFELDNILYALEGNQAVRYGGGKHTKHKHLKYHQFFMKRIRPNERVLDVGCGIGQVSYHIAHEAQAMVTGIDIDEKNIEKARQMHSHPNVNFIVGNILEDLPKGPYDTIILSNVLEHLPKRPAFLQTLLEKTETSRFLIRVPLFERDWRVPLKKEVGVDWRLDTTHETEYTVESFLRELQEARLKPIHMEVRWGEIWSEVVPDG